MDNRLDILIVEDSQAESQNLIIEIDKEVETFRLVGATNNSARAFEYVKNEQPDVVILDLELHQGGGDGLELMQMIKDAGLPRPPFILVTTNNVSAIIHKAARNLGADYIMTKSLDGYCAKFVLNFLKTTKSAILSRRTGALTEPQETPAQAEKRMHRIITGELNKVGISPKSVGYRYLAEAIAIIKNEPVQHICNVIGKKYGKSENSVERAMQNAINRAWNTSNVNDLLENYTAKIKSDKGVPTLTEFIYFYAQKIENEY